MKIKDLRCSGRRAPGGTYRDHQPLMESVPRYFLRRSDNYRIRSSRLHNVKPGSTAPRANGRSCKSAQCSVCRFPSSSQSQPVMAHQTSAQAMPRILRSDVLAHAEELLTGRPGEVCFQSRWAPWTVAMPPHGPGIALGRLSSQGWLSAGARTWAVPSQCRLVDGEAVRRGSSIGRRCDRYLGTVTAPRVHFLWAESELHQNTARFGNAVAACRIGTAFGSPVRWASSGKERLT
jgi:hypothetical protein